MNARKLEKAAADVRDKRQRGVYGTLSAGRPANRDRLAGAREAARLDNEDRP